MTTDIRPRSDRGRCVCNPYAVPATPGRLLVRSLDSLRSIRFLRILHVFQRTRLGRVLRYAFGQPNRGANGQEAKDSKKTNRSPDRTERNPVARLNTTTDFGRTPVTDKQNSIFGLTSADRSNLLARLKKNAAGGAAGGRALDEARWTPDPKTLSFEEFPALKQLRMEQSVAERAGILNPFFQCHDGIAKAETRIGGVPFLNFSTYDYLDLNGHPELEKAGIEAMERWGTSASASRLVSGERPPHRALEKTIADLYETEDAIAYVSGHATNVSTIGKLFGPQDVIFHDALAHNSIVMGALASGARRISYPHNDTAALERLLKEHRPKAQRALIVTEGVFSMDGNICDLPGLLRLKKTWGCFLMVDEAHALGVLGKTGRGTFEHFGVDPKLVDLWMGTLSKSCCGCGGYIAGTKGLVELLKFTSPGFVYSVGMSPVLAAASRRSIELMLAEPERVAKLQAVSHEFVRYAKEKGLDTGGGGRLRRGAYHARKLLACGETCRTAFRPTRERDAHHLSRRRRRGRASALFPFRRARYGARSSCDRHRGGRAPEGPRRRGRDGALRAQWVRKNGGEPQSSPPFGNARCGYAFFREYTACRRSRSSAVSTPAGRDSSSTVTAILSPL